MTLDELKPYLPPRMKETSKTYKSLVLYFVNGFSLSFAGKCEGITRGTVRASKTKVLINMEKDGMTWETDRRLVPISNTLLRGLNQ